MLLLKNGSVRVGIFFDQKVSVNQEQRVNQADFPICAQNENTMEN